MKKRVRELERRLEATEQELAEMRAAIVGAGAALSVPYPSRPARER